MRPQEEFLQSIHSIASYYTEEIWKFGMGNINSQIILPVILLQIFVLLQGIHQWLQPHEIKAGLGLFIEHCIETSFLTMWILLVHFREANWTTLSLIWANPLDFLKECLRISYQVWLGNLSWVSIFPKLFVRKIGQKYDQGIGMQV